MKAAVRLLLILALVAPAFASAQTSAAPAPTCKMFASATIVAPNTKVRLDWTTTNVTSGYLPEVGALPPNGYVFVVPGKNTTYAASFTGPGGTIICRVGVGVSAGAPAGGGGVTVPAGQPVNVPTATLPVAPSTGITAPSGSGFVGGIVPLECRGRSTVAYCDLCSLAQLTQNIANFLLGLTVPAAALLFAWAGILYFSSRGDPVRIGQAHKIFKSVVIGFVIAVSAWVLVITVMNMLVHGGELGTWDWSSLKCQETREARKYNMSLSEYLSSSLPGLSSGIVRVPTGGSDTGCPAGSVPEGGRCIDYTGGRAIDVGPATGGGGGSGATSCPSGYSYTTDEGGYCQSTDPTTPDAWTEACPTGYVYTSAEGGYCENPNNPDDWLEVPSSSGANVPSSPSQTPRGDCSLAAAESFGSNAAVMSCIAGRESSCNPLIAGDQGYSIGLYQINMTANNVTCNGATINCPRAFNGSYSCRNGQCGAYKNGQYLGPVQTIDAGLAAECKSVLQNPACNVETAQQVLNTPRGLNNWSTYAQCR